MHLIVVGAGEVALQLLRRLSEVWDVTLVDTSPQRLSAAAARAGRPVATVHGDGSSRVVLERAGLAAADALLAATDDDDTNMEVCRLGDEAKIRRLLAVGCDPERVGEYRERGVAALSPAHLAGREIELHLEPQGIASKAFAGGRVEAVEFRVAPDSPVRGRPIRLLNRPSQIVAALARGGEVLMAPDGDLVLEPGDTVTVVGPARDLPDMIRSFTAASSRFPLDHGKRIAVGLASEADLETFREAVALTRTSQATSLVALHPGQELREGEEPTGEDPLPDRASAAAEGIQLHLRSAGRRLRRALLHLPEEESIGALVLSARPWAGGGWSRRALAVATRTHTPLLFARGTAPHRRILVAARRTPAGRSAARAAIDLAELGKAELSALAVVDPEFVAGEGAAEEADRALDWVKEQAAIRGLDVEARTGEGNPVRAFEEESRGADLVVLGLAEPRFAVRATLATHMARRSPVSVLLVPTRE